MLPLVHTRLRVGTGLACGPWIMVVQRGGFRHGKNGGALRSGGTWTGETEPACWYGEVTGHGEYLN